MSSEIRSFSKDENSCGQTPLGLQKEFPENPIFPKELARVNSVASRLSRKLQAASKWFGLDS